MFQPLCEVKMLKKAYPSFMLSDVSFSLRPGRITGFIGRNGAGKTTTIKSMLGLVHPDGGEISYFGTPLSGNEKKIKQRLGYSTGSVNYYPKKRIREIVAVTRPFFDSWDEDSYKEYRTLFSIDESKLPSELSCGMRVKLNLLLALSHRAEILILDEPTSSLDPFSRDELLDIFTELKDRGVSILFSTHITSDIEKCADDILYIKKGRLAADCTKEDFVKKYCNAGESIEQAILRLERGNDR